MQIVETVLQFGPLTRRTRTARIVIHHSASGDVPVAEIHRWHRNRGWPGVGYHYIIRANGTIERGRPEAMQGTHAPAANADGIAICLTGNFEVDPPTPAQMTSLVWLIGDIKRRMGDLKIEEHRGVAVTACPGKLFPFAALLTQLENTGPRLLVNDKATSASVRIVAGRTQVQLDGHWIGVRTLADALGATIGWDETTKTVSLTL